MYEFLVTVFCLSVLGEKPHLRGNKTGYKTYISVAFQFVVIDAFSCSWLISSEYGK